MGLDCPDKLGESPPIFAGYPANRHTGGLMRLMRSSAALATCALTASFAIVSSVRAQTVERRDPYLGTLQFGTGLIDIPVAIPRILMIVKNRCLARFREAIKK